MRALAYSDQLPDLRMIEPALHGDARGHFFESFNCRDFEAAIGRRVEFVQDNQSRSARGVLRGLHCQRAPHAQGKLVRVVQGEIYDVAVDVRHESPTFGRWAALRLSAQNRLQHWIPEGYAHGFLVLSGFADVLYKTTGYWTPECEAAIAWNDPVIGIAWPLKGPPLLSDKDRAAGSLIELMKGHPKG